MSQDDETLVVVEKPKRAPRKRVAKVVSEEAETPAPAPRKRAPRKSSEDAVKRTPRKRVAKEEDTPTPRKAPTPLASEKSNSKKSKKQRYVVGILMFLGIASSAAVGFTDKGSINVEATITARNEQSRAAGREGEIVPVQNTDVQPDGGLIGLMGSDSTPPAAPVASSTEAVASSSAPVGNIPMTMEEAAQATQENAPAEPAQ
jgi:hypothetical protein